MGDSGMSGELSGIGGCRLWGKKVQRQQQGVGCITEHSLRVLVL